MAGCRHLCKAADTKSPGMKRQNPQRAFLYSDLVTALRSRIARALYTPGSRLPSLAALTKEFGVSAITVRRALRELTYEGLVQGHQGLGVFVRTKPRIHRVLAGDPDRTIGDEIGRAGFVPRLEEVDYSTIKANDDVAARFGIRPGTNIFCHQKLTFANDEPVALHVLHLRTALARKLRPELSKLFLFALLDKHRIKIANLKCEFSSTTLSAEHARLFHLPAGQPMMRVDYTAFGTDGHPLLLGLTICRPDRFVFEVNLPRRTKARSSRKPNSTFPTLRG
jgi:GntR family transcriptional regulator